MQVIFLKSVDCIVNDHLNDPCRIATFLIFTDLNIVAKKAFI